MTDPFAAPAQVASAHASADSFRGRLVLIKPTRIEYNVPKSQSTPNILGNKVTADVTVVDGLGPVQVFQQRVATGKFIAGPIYRGVWFNQDRLAKMGGLVDPTEDPVQMTGMVLGRLETYKPGQMAGQGNPWGFLPPTEDDKAIARAFLAASNDRQNTAIVEAAASVAAAPVADENPFGASGYTKEPPF